MSSSAHIDKKEKDILIQGLEHIWIAMEQIVICLSMVQKFTNSKQKNSEIIATPLCLGNISTDWSTDNMKKNRI